MDSDLLASETPHGRMHSFWNCVSCEELTMYVRNADGTVSATLKFDPFRMFDCTNLAEKLFPKSLQRRGTDRYGRIKLVSDDDANSKPPALDAILANSSHSPLYPLPDGAYFVLGLPEGQSWGYESTQSEIIVLPQYVNGIEQIFSDDSSKGILARVVGPTNSGKTLFGLFVLVVIAQVRNILAEEMEVWDLYTIGYHTAAKLRIQNPMYTCIFASDSDEDNGGVTSRILEEMEKDVDGLIPLVLISDDVNVIPFAQQLYLFIARDDNPCVEQHEAQVSRSGSRGYPVVRLEFPPLSQDQKVLCGMMDENGEESDTTEVRSNKKQKLL